MKNVLKNALEKSRIKSIWLFCLLSLLVGGINGFLGTGGGIILVYMLKALTDNDEKDSFALTLCAIIPMSVVSLFAYAGKGSVDTELIREISIPAIVGGALGALLTDKIKTQYLSILFSVLVVYSGARMVMG